jgi:hypothetical protein
MREVSVMLEVWRHHYNHEHPHGGLSNRPVPKSAIEKSSVSFLAVRQVESREFGSALRMPLTALFNGDQQVEMHRFAPNTKKRAENSLCPFRI